MAAITRSDIVGTFSSLGRGLHKVLPMVVIAVMSVVVIYSVWLLRPPETPAPTVLLAPSVAEGFTPPRLIPSSSFEYDRAILKPEGVSALARIAGDLKADNAAEVVIIGFTDKRGEVAHNSKLSQDRANAVKVELGKVLKDAKLLAVGVGARFSRTGTRCDGKARDEMIICLAPDRRVEIWSRPAESEGKSDNVAGNEGDPAKPAG